jgi:hypothetical protein
MSRAKITARDAERRYALLKAELASLGLVRPGSLVRRHMPCGKPACRCMGDPPILHGPYYQWTHKIRGKTVTMRLSRTQAQRCKDWIRNHRQLKKLLRKMEALSLKETDRILRTISKS